MSIKSKSLIAAALLTASLSSSAGVILGGSSLVDNSGLAQLQAWLGQGSLALTNVFTKTAGSTSQDFHTALDGQGATFSLMSVSENGGAFKTIGGYNPLSWSSIGDYNFDANQATWTSFIFNLTDSRKLDQTNAYQAYNNLQNGPSFGGGRDIQVNADLASGYSLGYSYGAGMDLNTMTAGSDFGWSLYDGTNYAGTSFIVGALEVFSIAALVTQVPEPGTLALAGAALVGLAAVRRKRRAVPSAATLQGTVA